MSAGNHNSVNFGGKANLAQFFVLLGWISAQKWLTLRRHHRISTTTHVVCHLARLGYLGRGVRVVLVTVLLNMQKSWVCICRRLNALLESSFKRVCISVVSQVI